MHESPGPFGCYSGCMASDNPVEAVEGRYLGVTRSAARPGSAPFELAFPQLAPFWNSCSSSETGFPRRGDGSARKHFWTSCAISRRYSGATLGVIAARISHYQRTLLRLTGSESRGRTPMRSCQLRSPEAAPCVSGAARELKISPNCKTISSRPSQTYLRSKLCLLHNPKVDTYSGGSEVVKSGCPLTLASSYRQDLRNEL
jgi:hypothetical protein